MGWLVAQLLAFSLTKKLLVYILAKVFSILKTYGIPRLYRRSLEANKRIFSNSNSRERNQRVIKSIFLMPNSLYSRYLNWKTVVFKRPSGPSNQLEKIKEEAKERALKEAEGRPKNKKHQGK